MTNPMPWEVLKGWSKNGVATADSAITFFLFA